MKTNKNKVVVTRKWLMDFADRIYNPKDRSFLSLCNGTLQNGPDPKDTKRTMHCGLGELYFQLTGKHPKETRVDEDGVIKAVVNGSTLYQKVLAEQEALKTVIKNLKIPSISSNSCNDMEGYFSAFKDEANNLKPTDDSRVYNFVAILDNIPLENDNGNESHTLEVFRGRAKRVANVLRKAAKLLPE